MQHADYLAFLKRADAAVTVRELRQVAEEAKAAHPDDPTVELLDQTCLLYATALISRQRERGERYTQRVTGRRVARRHPDADVIPLHPGAAPAATVALPADATVPALALTPPALLRC